MVKNIKMGKISLPMDVRSSNDIPAFEKMLSHGPMAVVLVYADWCGHCTNYKKNVWEPLKSTKGRKVNMASVHYDQLENTSLNNSKIEGYPSLLVVGTDKKPATFNTDSGVTNAMPNANNVNTMKSLLKTSPNANVSNANVSNANVSNAKMNTNMNSSMNTNTNSSMNSSMNMANNMLSMNSSMNNSVNMNSDVGTNTNTNTNMNISVDESPQAVVETISPPNLSSDSVSTLGAVNTNAASNLNAASNTNAASNLNAATNSVIEANRNVKRNNQGTTPLARGGGGGGRLYRKLATRKQRRSKRRSSKRKN